MLSARTLKQLNTVKLLTSRIQSSQFRSIHAQAALLNNQSFFGAFRESVKRQIKENQDFNQSVKQLQDTSDGIKDSETLKRAKDLFNRARSDVSESAATRQIQEGLAEVKKYADSVGKSVDDVLKEMNETVFIKATKERLAKVGKSLYDTTEPIRQSEAYKAVKSDIETIVDDSASRYGGYRSKEARQAAKEKLDKKFGADSKNARFVKVNPEAGENIVLHKDSKWTQSWKNFKDNSPLVQGLYSAKKNYDESENSLVSSVRDVTDKISDIFSSVFAESEQAKAIKQVRMTLDPNFDLENFLRELREYIVPDILDAFHSSDKITLRQWCSEATFNVLNEGFKSQEQQGLIPDSQILDLRRVDIPAVKILENDVPVFVVSFETQEIILFRKKTTKEIAFGREDHVEKVRYVMVFVKSEEDLDNKHTNGWKVMEMSRHSSSPSK